MMFLNSTCMWDLRFRRHEVITAYSKHTHCVSTSLNLSNCKTAFFWQSQNVQHCSSCRRTVTVRELTKPAATPNPCRWMWQKYICGCSLIETLDLVCIVHLAYIMHCMLAVHLHFTHRVCTCLVTHFWTSHHHHYIPACTCSMSLFMPSGIQLFYQTVSLFSKAIHLDDYSGWILIQRTSRIFHYIDLWRKPNLDVCHNSTHLIVFLGCWSFDD